jgi:DNA repair exonuclease SbcCD ATPase subunit
MRKGRWSNDELAEIAKIGDEFVATQKEDWDAAFARLEGDAKRRSLKAVKDRYAKIKAERRKKEKEAKEKEEEQEKDLVVEEEAKPVLSTSRSSSSPLAPSP